MHGSGVHGPGMQGPGAHILVPTAQTARLQLAEGPGLALHPLTWLGQRYQVLPATAGHYLWRSPVLPTAPIRPSSSHSATDSINHQPCTPAPTPLPYPCTQEAGRAGAAPMHHKPSTSHGRPCGPLPSPLQTPSQVALELLWHPPWEGAEGMHLGEG